MKPARKKTPPLTVAKRKLAVLKKAKPTTKREWGAVIRGAEAILRKAGV